MHTMYSYPKSQLTNHRGKGDHRHFAFPLLVGLALTAPLWARRYPVYLPYPYPVPRPYPYMYPKFPSPYFYYYRQPWIYY